MRYALVVLAGIAALPAAAQTLEEFAYAVPIEAGGAEAFYRVVVPQAAYESAAFDDLRDLRVFNGRGEAVPHAFRSAELHARKAEPVPLAIFPLMAPRDTRVDDLDLSVGRAGDKLSVKLRGRADKPGPKVLVGYLVDASAIKTPLSGLTVAWGSRGAEQLTYARLEASDDLKHWTTMVVDAPLGAMRHVGQLLERSSIEFRAQQAKYLRLTWPEADKAIELASVSGLVPDLWEQPERSWIELTATPDATHPGDYPFELKGRLPIDRIEFRLPQENTVAPLQVLVRDDPKGQWQPVASAVAWRLKQDGRELASPALTVHAGARRFWLVRADMKSGGLGAGTLGVRAGWTPRELVFAARGEPPFKLAYGNARAQGSALAIDTLVPGLRGEQPPKLAAASTGAPQQVAGPAALSRPPDTKRYALWVALLAAVGVLGWMAWLLFKQMQKP